MNFFSSSAVEYREFLFLYYCSTTHSQLRRDTSDERVLLASFLFHDVDLFQNNTQHSNGHSLLSTTENGTFTQQQELVELPNAQLHMTVDLRNTQIFEFPSGCLELFFRNFNSLFDFFFTPLALEIDISFTKKKTSLLIYTATSPGRSALKCTTSKCTFPAITKDWNLRPIIREPVPQSFSYQNYTVLYN